MREIHTRLAMDAMHQVDYTCARGGDGGREEASEKNNS